MVEGNEKDTNKESQLSKKEMDRFEDEQGYEIDRDGNYNISRKAYKMSQLGKGTGGSPDLSYSHPVQKGQLAYKQEKVRGQLERSLSLQAAELSRAEEKLQSLIFNKNLGGKVFKDSKQKKLSQKEKTERAREIYENLNFFDETERKRRLAQKRQKNKVAEQIFQEIKRSVLERLKVKSISEEREEEIGKMSLILSKSKTSSGKQVKSQVVVCVAKKIDLASDLKECILEASKIQSGEDSYYKTVQEQLRKEKEVSLRESFA